VNWRDHITGDSREKYQRENKKIASGGCLGRTEEGRFTQRNSMRRSVKPEIHASPTGKPKEKKLAN